MFLEYLIVDILSKLREIFGIDIIGKFMCVSGRNFFCNFQSNFWIYLCKNVFRNSWRNCRINSYNILLLFWAIPRANYRDISEDFLLRILGWVYEPFLGRIVQCIGIEKKIKLIYKWISVSILAFRLLINRKFNCFQGSVENVWNLFILFFTLLTPIRRV